MPAGNVICSIGDPPETLVKCPGKDRPKQGAECKIQKINHSRLQYRCVRRIGFLDYSIWQHCCIRKQYRLINPGTNGGRYIGWPNKIHTRHASKTTAPPIITGFLRPILSEINPSRGHPIIHPKGTLADRKYSSTIVNTMSILQKADTPDHIKDCCRNEKQSCNHSAQDRLRIFKNYFKCP